MFLFLLKPNSESSNTRLLIYSTVRHSMPGLLLLHCLYWIWETFRAAAVTSACFGIFYDTLQLGKWDCLWIVMYLEGRYHSLMEVILRHFSGVPLKNHRIPQWLIRPTFYLEILQIEVRRLCLIIVTNRWVQWAEYLVCGRWKQYTQYDIT
jgi:hypothetical protein